MDNVDNFVDKMWISVDKGVRNLRGLFKNAENISESEELRGSWRGEGEKVGIINEIINGIMDEIMKIINENNLLCVDLPRSSKVHPQLDLLVKHTPHWTATNCCLSRRWQGTIVLQAKLCCLPCHSYT